MPSPHAILIAVQGALTEGFEQHSAALGANDEAVPLLLVPDVEREVQIERFSFEALIAVQAWLPGHRRSSLNERGPLGGRSQRASG